MFWDDLAIPYRHFADVGLASNAADALIWETCQKAELVLIMDNRNKDDIDSLEAVIQTPNGPTCLPVFTIGKVSRLRHSRDYTNRVIEKLLDSLQRIDELRGTGRLYLP